MFAVTFTANPRRGTESADEVLRQNAWLASDERYDADGQHWTDIRAERAMLNTHDKVANAVRSAIEKGYAGQYDTHRPYDADRPWERSSFKRLDVIHSQTYRSRAGSTDMHFFILYIERF